jgi:hypothetical protein
LPTPASSRAAGESIFGPSSEPVTVRPAQPGAGVPIGAPAWRHRRRCNAPRGRKVDTAYEVMRGINSRREEMKAVGTE